MMIPLITLYKIKYLSLSSLLLRPSRLLGVESGWKTFCLPLLANSIYWIKISKGISVYESSIKELFIDEQRSFWDKYLRNCLTDFWISKIFGGIITTKCRTKSRFSQYIYSLVINYILLLHAYVVTYTKNRCCVFIFGNTLKCNRKTSASWEFFSYLFIHTCTVLYYAVYAMHYMIFIILESLANKGMTLEGISHW